ncbi:hypothetical protein G5S37_10870 [Roseimicrobium sp. ORNL1]|nr:hypothetical protein G5S37_10870 [Roseimicrobium sp. ORNL1]
MKEGAPKKSRAIIWTLCILAVFTLYVGSTGPIRHFQIKGTLPEPPPDWQKVFYRPVAYLHKYTPLSKPLDVYSEWWWKLAGMPYPPSGSYYDLKYY